MNITIDQLPAVIDHYVELRNTRLDVEKRVEELKKAETAHKLAIEACLREAGLTVGGGSRYKATLVAKDKPVAESWALLYKYITETNSFDLLQKRLTENAVKLRWEEGEVIPGISKFPVTELSITKV